MNQAVSYSPGWQWLWYFLSLGSALQQQQQPSDAVEKNLVKRGSFSLGLLLQAIL